MALWIGDLMNLIDSKERFFSCAKILIVCGIFINVSVNAKETKDDKALEPQPAQTHYSIINHLKNFLNQLINC